MRRLKEIEPPLHPRFVAWFREVATKVALMEFTDEDCEHWQPDRQRNYAYTPDQVFIQARAVLRLTEELARREHEVKH